MTLADFRRALDWAAAEGWNPGLRDAEAFHPADPDGFLCSDDACIAAIRMGEAQGFIGLYIVRPEARGQGHGLAIWQAAMAHLAGRTIGLDGVVAQQANYRRSGFRFAWNNARYETRGGIAPGVGTEAEPAVLDAGLVAFDAAHAGAPRADFLRGWIGAAGHVALVKRGPAGIEAFGVIRPCREGSKIGPLFAATPARADAMLRALAAHRADGPLIIDVPEDQPHAVALARAHGMEKRFETAHVCRPDADASPRGHLRHRQLRTGLI
jgi:hypothetical protein